jgi:hypothetical protein
MLAECGNIHGFQLVWKRPVVAGMMHGMDAVAGQFAADICRTARQENGIDDSG